MALKAGRVGVAPDQVDEFGQVKSEATSGYTKQEADAKFETQIAATEALALKQPITLQVPIEMLSGTKLTVEEALQGLNNEVTGKFALLSFTSDATETDNDLEYPDGFNQNNTYVFLFMVKDGSGNWREGIGTMGTGERVFCVLKSDVITLSILAAEYKNKDMKILLMKI